MEIAEGIKKGKTKKEIYSELELKFEDKKILTRILGRYTEKKVKEKHKIFTYTIVSALLILGIIKWIAVSYIYFNLLSLIFSMILPVLLCYGVIKYIPEIYTILIYLLLVNIYAIYHNGLEIEEILHPMNTTTSVGLIIIFSATFYLKIKLFPYYGVIMPKKDGEGNYRFE